MNTQEIDQYLKVRRLIRARNVVVIVSVVAAAVLGCLLVLGYQIPFARPVLFALVVVNWLVLVSFDDAAITAPLLRLVEAQINKDPAAIKYLASMNSTPAD